MYMYATVKKCETVDQMVIESEETPVVEQTATVKDSETVDQVKKKKWQLGGSVASNDRCTEKELGLRCARVICGRLCCHCNFRRTGT